MRRMISPNANRKGEREVHDVPERRVTGLTAKGWVEVVGKTATHEPESSRQDATDQGAQKFDMSGSWFQVRAQVRDAVSAERFPASKDEARQWLRDAGYEVVE